MTREALAGRQETQSVVPKSGEPAARRRHIRWHFREGMEAALKGNPRKIADSDPRTGLGLVCRGLVLEAGRGRTSAIKLVLQLVEWEEPQEESEQRTAAANDDEQGIISKFEPEWDWDRTGKWETEREPEPDSESPARDQSEDSADKAQKEILKQELREKLTRLNQAQLDEQERQARLCATTALSANFARPSADPP